jgi:hypothetical protein
MPYLSLRRTVTRMGMSPKRRWLWEISRKLEPFASTTSYTRLIQTPGQPCKGELVLRHDQVHGTLRMGIFVVPGKVGETYQLGWCYQRISSSGLHFGRAICARKFVGESGP